MSRRRAPAWLVAVFAVALLAFGWVIAGASYGLCNEWENPGGLAASVCDAQAANVGWAIAVLPVALVLAASFLVQRRAVIYVGAALLCLDTALFALVLAAV